MTDHDNPDDNKPSGSRMFLTRSLAAGGAMSAMPLAALGTAQAAEQNPDFSTPVQNKPYTPTYFQEAEVAFLQAACARLIPNDDNGPGAVEAGVIEYLDRQMESGFGHAANWYMHGPFADAAPEFGYQSKLKPREVYRAGIAATEAYCKQHFDGKVFADLRDEQKDDVLKQLESGKIQYDDVKASDFFSFLLTNTREGFLSDPIHGGNKGMAGWKLIGFPGARADFLDWVGRNEKYPLGPVSISGERG